jgi:hypothetical protein
MKLKRTVIMFLLLLFMTFGTVNSTQLTYVEGEVKEIPIGLYWDEECTKTVTFIDFGKIARGQNRYVTFWLEKHITDKGRISWGSANFNPSSNEITECWERKVGRFGYISNWNKKMKTGDLWEIRYTIQVAQDVQVGVYSWDLMISHVISHSLVHSLQLTCILSVTQ